MADSGYQPPFGGTNLQSEDQQSKEPLDVNNRLNVYINLPFLGMYSRPSL